MANPQEDVLQDEKIKQILLETHYVSEEDLKAASDVAQKTKTSLVDVLRERGIITPDLLGQAISEFLQVRYVDLNSRVPDSSLIALLPEDVAQTYQAVTFAATNKEVTIATSQPLSAELKGALKKVFGSKKVTIAYSLPEDVGKVLLSYRKPLNTRFAKILEKKTHLAPELVTQIFEDALALRASDIHFEPLEKEVVIRFRIDGILQEAGRLPRENYDAVLNRIKVQSQLRIDQHATAQDGAIRAGLGEKTVDMRVSIVPTLAGEKIVIRLLAQYVRGFALADLGFSTNDQQRMQIATKKPFGMILVVGPTGSGKTTTLYSLLRGLHRPEVNITTIEDPVEYRIPGINQIQVNPATDLTFARGLRAIVRQDPNIILVGEIRDKETAEIAVNAALTGHLLLSTFHANDAATAIPRLIDIGIEPFLLASTLELVVAQRLVRRICEACRQSIKRTAEDIRQISPLLGEYFSAGSYYKGKRCNTCNNTGYSGRVALFECIVMTRDLQDLLLRHPSRNEIWSLARQQGSLTLFEDGIEKVHNGMTTIEELFRIAVPPAKSLAPVAKAKAVKTYARKK